MYALSMFLNVLSGKFEAQVKGMPMLLMRAVDPRRLLPFFNILFLIYSILVP